MVIEGESFSDALNKAFGDMARNIVGSTSFFLPFFLMALLAASTSRKSTTVRGVALLFTFSVVFSALSFVGHMFHRQAIQEEAWTAAALTLGFFAMALWFMLPLALLGRWLLIRKFI